VSNRASGFDKPEDPPTASKLINVNYGKLLGDRALSPLAVPQTWKAVVHRAENLPENWQWSEQNKVIFVCHSQGGISVRQLLHYMSGSAPPDLDQFSPRDERSRAKAVITLGTPHKGSTIIQFSQARTINNLHWFFNQPANSATAMQEFLGQDADLNAVVDFVALTSFAKRQDRVLDLGLDHWGFTRIHSAQETYQTMRARIAPDVVRWFNGTTNGLYDNSISGAQDLNEATGAVSLLPTKTHFFTMSFCATNPTPNQTLTAQDIREFFNLFRLGGIPNSLGVPGLIETFLSLANQLHISPPLLSVLGWITGVANRHLGTLGFFSQIPRPGPQIPRADMLAVIAPFAYAMGGIHVPGEDREPNDGIVNTMSMDGPEGRVRDARRFVDELDATGVTEGRETFWHFGLNTRIDHADQLGIFTDRVTVSSLLMELVCKC